MTIQIREITFNLTSHDDGYNVRDWFRWDQHGEHPVDLARSATSADVAEHILSTTYLGPDVDGVEVLWEIFE